MSDVPLVPEDQRLHHKNHDTAKRLVADGALKFQRPWIAAGGLKFVWPVGTEAFRISGTTLVGMHKYIGGNTVDAHEIHYNEGHIEMSGTLPGLTSPGNMGSLKDICMSRSKKTLSLPGILARVQYVVIETYDFSHAAEDRTSSIDYSITMVQTGLAGKAKGLGGSGGSGSALSFSQGLSVSPSSPLRGSTSESARTFATTQGVDTFRVVADKVYGDVDQWVKLVDLNMNTLINNNPNLSIRPDQMPYFRWPVGTKIAY